jgi:hypothetical protein
VVEQETTGVMAQMLMHTRDGAQQSIHYFVLYFFFWLVWINYTVGLTWLA